VVDFQHRQLYRNGLGLLLYLILAGWGLTACTEESGTAPPIPDSTLVHVLTDLHLAGARDELFVDVPAGRRDSIFVHWAINEADFSKTLVYYADHPEAYLKVYDQVLDLISAQRSRYLASSDSLEASTPYRP
jgi:hypothetical protein